MALSSELDMTLAGQLLAGRLEVSLRTKQAFDVSHGALLGGGLGLGAGLLGTAMSSRPKKRWLRNALLGGALGAGAGAGATLLGHGLSGVMSTPDSELPQTTYADLTKQIKDLHAKGQAVPAELSSAWEKAKAALPESFKQPEVKTPALDSAAFNLQRMHTEGINPENTKDLALGLVPRAGQGAAGGMVGYGLGKLYDDSTANMRYENQLPHRIKSLDEATLSKNLRPTQQQSVHDAPAGALPTSPRERFLANVRRTLPLPTQHTSGTAFGANTVAGRMHPTQFDNLRNAANKATPFDPKLPMDPSKPAGPKMRGFGGRGVGTALGIALPQLMPNLVQSLFGGR